MFIARARLTIVVQITARARIRFTLSSWSGAFHPNGRSPRLRFVADRKHIHSDTFSSAVYLGAYSYAAGFSRSRVEEMESSGVPSTVYRLMSRLSRLRVARILRNAGAVTRPVSSRVI